MVLGHTVLFPPPRHLREAAERCALAYVTLVCKRLSFCVGNVYPSHCRDRGGAFLAFSLALALNRHRPHRMSHGAGRVGRGTCACLSDAVLFLQAAGGRRQCFARPAERDDHTFVSVTRRFNCWEEEQGMNHQNQWEVSSAVASRKKGGQNREEQTGQKETGEQETREGARLANSSSWLVPSCLIAAVSALRSTLIRRLRHKLRRRSSIVRQSPIQPHRNQRDSCTAPAMW